jgi:C1A family cysteine protease
LIFCNSWGPNWAEGGYGYLPYDYLIAKGLARDFWTIRLTSDTLPEQQDTPDATASASQPGH